jgi:hypothetical protein
MDIPEHYLSTWEPWAQRFQRILAGLLGNDTGISQPQRIISSWRWHVSPHIETDGQAVEIRYCVVEIQGSANIVINQLREDNSLKQYTGCLLMQMVGDFQQHRRWVAAPPNCNKLTPEQRMFLSCPLAVGALIGYVQFSGLNMNSMYPLDKNEVNPSNN